MHIFNKNFFLKKYKGFTLIELLVVVSIIGVLLGISVFSLQQSKKSGRDAKRKADLELIRSGVELYRADCKVYPPTNKIIGDSVVYLKGDDSFTSCDADNEYISKIPSDPQDPYKSYSYVAPTDQNAYIICASLEIEPKASPTPDEITSLAACNCSGDISELDATCNYVVTNP